MLWERRRGAYWADRQTLISNGWNGSGGPGDCRLLKANRFYGGGIVRLGKGRADSIRSAAVRMLRVALGGSGYYRSDLEAVAYTPECWRGFCCDRVAGAREFDL